MSKPTEKVRRSNKPESTSKPKIRKPSNQESGRVFQGTGKTLLPKYFLVLSLNLYRASVTEAHHSGVREWVEIRVL